ncbi:MAG: hydantoinase B/oxoprolinase family protein, partial [Candidatus Heimdallarchaeaceae archaeon]
PGRKGKNIIISSDNRSILPSKTTRKIKKGDIVIIETPGGGGYGSA